MEINIVNKPNWQSGKLKLSTKNNDNEHIMMGLTGVQYLANEIIIILLFAANCTKKYWENESHRDLMHGIR